MSIILGVTIGNLVLDRVTALILGFATILFLGSFVFIARNNDMKGALMSLLPKRNQNWKQSQGLGLRSRDMMLENSKNLRKLEWISIHLANLDKTIYELQRTRLQPQERRHKLRRSNSRSKVWIMLFLYLWRSREATWYNKPITRQSGKRIPRTS